MPINVAQEKHDLQLQTNQLLIRLTNFRPPPLPPNASEELWQIQAEAIRILTLDEILNRDESPAESHTIEV